MLTHTNAAAVATARRQPVRCSQAQCVFTCCYHREKHPLTDFCEPLEAYLGRNAQGEPLACECKEESHDDCPWDGKTIFTGKERP